MTEARRAVAAHLPDLDEERRETAERLVDVVLATLPEAEYDRKWDRLTFTLGGDWHHWICAIAATKSAVKLVLHKGAMFTDREGLMEGTGKYSRSIPARSPDEVDAAAIEPILREAAARQNEM